MGQIHPPQPVKYIVGLLLPSEAELEPVCQEIEQILGPIDLQTSLIPFDYTNYYEAEMGSLYRTYLGFEKLDSPDRLAAVKQATNEIEDRWRREDGGRNVNIDPGYLTQFQLVLASTKPFAHRIYLERGIWAEVTLLYKEGRYHSLPWTYPDYMAHAELFKSWREQYKKQLRTFKHPNGFNESSKKDKWRHSNHE